MITNDLYNLTSSLDINQKEGEYLLKYINHIHSFMSLMTLLLYDSIIIEDKHPQLSLILKKMSIDELDHLYFLSRVTFKLGCDPRLWVYHDDLKEYWSPGYNIYTHDINSLLSIIIMNKNNLINELKKGIQAIDNHCIKKILLHFIEEEYKHIQLINHYSIGC